MLTARRRPSGPLAHVSRAATMLFMAACFVLIAASINAFASGYFSPRQ